MKNIQVVLARRPNGTPVAEDFSIRETPVIQPDNGQALIENIYISLDAGFRNWMDEDAGDEVLPAMPLGQPVMGLTVGRVITSKHPGLPVGKLVMGRLAWESFSLASDDFLVPLDDNDAIPEHYHLGILGDTGMSAYFGLKDIAAPGPGDTVLVSAAAGSVGYVAGQIARIMGAKRIVGITSTEAKRQRLIKEVGYDEVINYRQGNLDEQLKSACPAGVDVYFDNVGGPILETVLGQINQGARIPFCGAVADYSRTAPSGPSNLFMLVTQCARLEGFLTHTKLARYDEARQQLKAWMGEGALKTFVQSYQGVDQCGIAFADLFAGNNFGKTIVKV
ncbi:MAG TPA: NADP-dependent oxidoreductase [Gammaproteobacteria bacterium]|nr:NADP-dependent oxidoreductase [Gammaproteobacteria bacterium]HIK69883.1 NADP-dependent oxidoreductase [Pseudomonadales bacterium]